ncbi:hypothetical protein V8C44DRAFT_210478 [Trichoderma aethiopicum]
MLQRTLYSTLQTTNETTNCAFAEDFTPFTATGGAAIFTTNNKTTDSFTEIQHDMTTNYSLIGHLDDLSPVLGPCSTATVSEPLSSEPNNGSSDEDMEASPGSGIQDASHDLDPDGNSKPGYKWCCNKWRKNDGNFKKHLRTHDPQLPCEAEPLGKRHCTKKFADKKGRDRHYWVSHKGYARKQKIPKPDSRCENCKTKFSRKDNGTRHLNRFPECRAAVERMLKRTA